MARMICAVVVALCCACGGSSGPKPLVSGEASPIAIAADATNVYWLNGVSGELRKVGVAGGAASTLASGFVSPRALVIDGSNAYWASGDGTIRSVALSGGTPTTIATEPDGYVPFAIALVGSSLYWLSNGSSDAKLVTAKSGGGARTEIGTPLPAYDLTTASLLTSDGTTIYWMQSDGNLGSLDSTGAPQVLAKRLGSAVSGITVQNGVLWFVQSFSGTPALVKKGLGTTDAAALVVTVPITLQMAADASALYLASGTSVAITKVTLPDGKDSKLVTDDKGASAVAIGPGGVYYSTQDGRILHSAR